MIYLTVEEIVGLNAEIIMITSPDEMIGVKDPTLLESAIGRPLATFGGVDLYPTLFEKAAALMESLAKNHAFQNANKRTALIATITLLMLNGYDLNMPDEVAVNYAVDVTTGGLDHQASAAMLEKYSVPRR